MSQGGAQEKTEQATAHRLRKARRDGEAPQSRDFVTTTVSVLGFLALLWMLGPLGAQFVTLTRDAIAGAFAPEFEPAARSLAASAGGAAVDVLAPLALIALLAAPVASFVAQGGFTPRPFKLRPEVLNPIANAGQKLSKQNFFELLKTLVRFAVILGLMVLLFRSWIGPLFLSPFCGLDCAMTLALDAATMLALSIFAAMAVLALLDLAAQRRFFADRMKMSKDELRREQKDTQGDPKMKAARLGVARRVLTVTPEEAADYATAVLRDGEGRAAAVIVGQDETTGQLVVTVALAGTGALARSLMTAAHAHGKPIVGEAALPAALQGYTGLQPVPDPDLRDAVAAALKRAGLQF